MRTHPLIVGLALLLAIPAESAALASQRPSLLQVEQVLLSTATEDFGGHDGTFQAAAAWHERRLAASPDRRAPHLACGILENYSRGRRQPRELVAFLSQESFRWVSNDRERGACFIVTASPSQSAAVSRDLQAYRLASFGAIPPPMKLAPGLLNIEGSRSPGGGPGDDNGFGDGDDAGRDLPGRLLTTHGKRMRFKNVGGLDLELSPGVLPALDFAAAEPFIDSLLDGLSSASMELHALSFWSDPAALVDDDGDFYRLDDQLAGGVLRAREWTRAADVVQGLSREADTSPGDVCGWGGINLRHAGSDFVVVTGMDHLLYLGRGAGGTGGAESDELQVACLMGLVSYFASIPEVQRIAPLHIPQLNNAVAGAIVQSGNIADKPLTKAGLDGYGEVIQIVDSGLDVTSCFFADADGEEVEHGYYFDEIGFASSLSESSIVFIFNNGSFPIDLSRRKIVQYTRLVRSDEEPQLYGSGTDTSVYGRSFPWYSASGFGLDVYEGHGTHTAGSAAGATLHSPANITACNISGDAGCLGGCLSLLGEDYLEEGELDVDTLCPMHGCDGTEGVCLSDDVAQTVTDNGGVARGAKLSIFDVSVDGTHVLGSLALNGLWASTEGSGCYVHSNSWGGDGDCAVDLESMAYDVYMYENPEHLLIFAAGNEGDPEDQDRTSCTIYLPAIAKNVLAIGATSSGATRWSLTSDDGDLISSYGGDDVADIDTVAYFSSYGLTRDGRIKPELVAPGDQVLSAESDGTEEQSCKLSALAGTSMSTPIVAGAAAMVRQYFRNYTFYSHDVNERGFCANHTDVNSTNAFVCKEFYPAAATVKAMLINSADLMGGSSEPDGWRGFGRVYLEAGLPLGGLGDGGLFVLDALDTAIEEYTVQEYSLEITPGTGLELRATLAWIDPAGDPAALVQLLNDLDLAVVAPDGTLYRMFSAEKDSRNVIERVIVASDVLEAASGDGAWTIEVSSSGLVWDTQPYSLVVTGPIAAGSGEFSSREASKSSSGGSRGSGMATVAVAVAAGVISAVLGAWEIL